MCPTNEMLSWLPKHSFRRHPGYAVLDAPLSRVQFIQPCKFRICEDAERNQPVARCSVAALQIAENH
jgi:hypothetical protein